MIHSKSSQNIHSKNLFIQSLAHSKIIHLKFSSKYSFKMAAGMEVQMVADMEVDKGADKVADKYYKIKSMS